MRMDRGRFTVIHYNADSALAAQMLAHAVTRDTFPWLPRASTRIVIQIAPDLVTFREWGGGAAFPWTAALAFVTQHRIVMQSNRIVSNATDPITTLRHELAHIALHDYLGALPTRWFDEGYASYAAGEARTDGFLITNAALLFRRMPSLDELDGMLFSPRGNDARAAYALSLRAVADLAALDPQRGLEPLLSAWKERGSFDLALRRASAQTASDFEARWQRRTRFSFVFLAVVADSAVLGAIVLLPLIPMYRSKRRAQRLRITAMREREVASDAAAQGRALDSLLRSLSPEMPPDPPHA
jgi:hypothetical protein